jgi:hypothetical protein
MALISAGSDLSVRIRPQSDVSRSGVHASVSSSNNVRSRNPKTVHADNMYPHESNYMIMYCVVISVLDRHKTAE